MLLRQRKIERQAYSKEDTGGLYTETTEVREAWLAQLSACQRARLVAGTDEEREARLQHMRDRLATETDEERQARLHQMPT